MRGVLPPHLESQPIHRTQQLFGRALRDFVRGDFSVDGTIAPENEAIKALNGLFYNDLSIETRRRINRYTVRAFRISDYSPEEPSELFYRLNQPTLLTAGEQRNSLYGPARTQLKSLVNLFQIKNSKETIGFSNARLAYDDVLARQLYFLQVGGFSIKTTEGQISDLFRKKDGFSPSVFNIAKDAIKQFSLARELAGKVRLNKASVLSLLLFYSRGNSSTEKEAFLAKFQNPSSGRLPAVMEDAQMLFADRASGRVTDVSSVFLRDCCLWLSFKEATNGHGPTPYIENVMQQIRYRVASRQDVKLEEIIVDAASVSEWSVL